MINQVNSNNELRTVNVMLTARGSLTIAVQSAGGGPVSGAQVGIYNGVANISQTASTDGSGRVTFVNLPPSQYQISANDPATGLYSSASYVTVSSGAAASATITLAASGTVVGRLLASDGVSPVAAYTIQMSGRRVTTAPDGSFRFDFVTIGKYQVQAIDFAGYVRAQLQVNIAQNGDIATANLTLVAQGTVTGHVYNPDSSIAANVPVSITSGLGFGRAFNGGTDTAGVYTIPGVPVSTFTASSSSQALEGEAFGQITQPGQTVTADINLQNAAINLPLQPPLFDANGMSFDIQQDGSLATGTNNVFTGDRGLDTRGLLLNVTSNGVSVPFTGGPVGTTQVGGQQIVVQGPSIAGLNITRKIYVPQFGYFARYLEILNNPTGAPITVDVNVESNLDGCAYFFCSAFAPQLMATSSGDALLDVTNPATADRWVQFAGGDPFNGVIPAVAVAFDGANAVDHVGSASYLQLFQNGQLSYGWQNVTVQPGATVAYMHFAVQETSQASSQAAAARLTQLPQEAMVGLTGTEASEIRNFAVPPTLTSTITPLPALTGTVSGQVLAGDNATVIPNTRIQFQSTNVLFDRIWNTVSDGNGNFSFASNFGNFRNMAIPIDNFTLSASHPNTRVQVTVNGAFVTGQTTTAQNIVFGNTGLLSGVVQRSNGVAVSGGTLTVLGVASYNIATDGSGSYVATGVPPGTFLITSSTRGAQGCCLTGVGFASVVAGQTTVANIVIPPASVITGTVTGNGQVPTPYARLSLSDFGNVAYSIQADASGNYAFIDVPAGTYLLTATDPLTGLITSVFVTVSGNQTVTRNLSLAGYGTVQVLLTRANGTAVSNANISIAGGSGTGGGLTTDSAGRGTISGVAVGPFTITARDPLNFYYGVQASASGSIPSNGATVQITVSFPPEGTVTGKVTYSDGTPVPNGSVSLTKFASYPNVSAYGSTDFTGTYSITGVPAQTTFQAYAYDGKGASLVFNNNSIAGDGQTLTLNFTLNAPSPGAGTATLKVIVFNQSGAPYSGANVQASDSSNAYFYGATDINGVANIPNIHQGNYVVQVRNGSLLVGTATGTVSQAQIGTTVNVPITTQGTISGSVTGTVFAADGQTPVAAAGVSFSDTSTGSWIGSASTDQTGHYQSYSALTTNTQGVTVTVSAPSNGSVTASRSGTFPAGGQSLSVNLTLPLAVIRGTVSYFDGTPVGNGQVFLTQTGAGGNTVAYFTYQTAADGSYLLVGGQVGSYALTGEDSDAGLIGTVNGNIVDVTQPQNKNITLSPSAKIVGTVTDSTGLPLAYAKVALTAPSQVGYAALETTADANGQYAFGHVALGNFSIQADGDTWSAFEYVSASGTLTTAGSVLTVNLAMPPTQSIFGTVFQSDGVTPDSYESICVENFDSTGPLGYFPDRSTCNNYADGNGNYVASNIPVGNVRITANPYSGSPSSIAKVVTDPSAPATVNLTLGNATPDPTFLLNGADGFYYDAYCDGSIGSGGTLDGALTSYSYGGFLFSLNNNFFPCPIAEITPVDPTTAQFGPAGLGGIQVNRKLYSPASGGFIRYLDTLTNPTANTLTVTVKIESFVNSSPRVFTSPSTTSGTFAIVDNAGACCMPVLGFVFAGPNSSTPVAATHFVDQDRTVSYTWNVTVPAGQTVILMHFGVQRDVTDDAGAVAQAQALVNLTDPNALTGMSAAEQSEVINFVVP